MDEIEYSFSDAQDARAYLREVARLWAAWAVGLAVISLSHGVVLVVASISVLVALIILARPLLPRTEALVPVNKREGGAARAALRGGTTRDRVLRNLAYGDEPMRAALAKAGLSSRWLAARHSIVGATVIAFVLVVVSPLL
ncbi:MAG: hypothetical protein U9N84_12015 [Actinomycetota bacterium]|nr:hypothetical protein [Actinomycetota bacterium]